MPQVVQLEEGGVRGTLKEYALVFLVLKLEAVEMALSLLAKHCSNVLSTNQRPWINFFIECENPYMILYNLYKEKDYICMVNPEISHPRSIMCINMV